MNDRDSYFWANLGILEKVGLWSPYYNKNTYSLGNFLYITYKYIIILLGCLHSFAELFLVCFHYKNISLDEMTVTLAYGVQHVLGMVKIFIIDSRSNEIRELDNRTKESPLFRHNDNKFANGINETVKFTNRIASVYWCLVISCVSCGGLTGAYITITNKNTMVKICNEKLNHLKFIINEWDDDDIKNEMNFYDVINNNEYTNENLYSQVELIEKDLISLYNLTKLTENNVLMNLKCMKPQKAYPYPVWLPFNAKHSPYFKLVFAVNFLIGFVLVFCILPIDLLVMSYMIYIKYQFDLLKDDLFHLRANSIDDLKREGIHINDMPLDLKENLITDKIVIRLKQIVNHHLAILDFFYNTNDMFAWILFAQYLGSAVMICGVLYQVSSQMNDMLSPKFFYSAFFYTGLLFQLFNICYYGSQVLTISERISEFAYFSEWNESGAYSPRLKPYLLMISSRSLRSTRLTAGKIVGVDLPVFLAVFKATYSYYTVLLDDSKRKH